MCRGGGGGAGDGEGAKVIMKGYRGAVEKCQIIIDY